nr:MAG TPA: hypothetical protein [Caudoviricetes sp.]
MSATDYSIYQMGQEIKNIVTMCIFYINTPL